MALSPQRNLHRRPGTEVENAPATGGSAHPSLNALAHCPIVKRTRASTAARGRNLRPDRHDPAPGGIHRAPGVAADLVGVAGLGHLLQQVDDPQHRTHEITGGQLRP